jgi:hypothetical protein
MHDLGKLLQHCNQVAHPTREMYAASARKAGFFESLRAYFTARQILSWKNGLSHFAASMLSTLSAPV